MTTRGERAAGGGVFWKLLDAIADLCFRPVRAAVRSMRRMLAFSLIVMGTMVTTMGRRGAIVRREVLQQIRRAGVGLLPFVGLISVAAGFVILGQTVVLLQRVGAEDVLGMVMVVVVFRELAPVATALVVLLRVGTATVVELATMRATGEVEALEALSMDPIHYLVLPRVIGMAVSVFGLAVYFMMGALLGGYLFCFIERLPLTMIDYVNQLARALTWVDFVLVILKTAGFGAVIAVLTCYRGLASPLRLEQVPVAATEAVTNSLVFCVVLDLVFLGISMLG